MKRLLSIFLVLSILACLSACGSGDVTDSSQMDASVNRSETENVTETESNSTETPDNSAAPDYEDNADSTDNAGKNGDPEGQSPTKNVDGTYTYDNLFGTGQDITCSINVDDYISTENGMKIVDMKAMMTDAGWTPWGSTDNNQWAPMGRIFLGSYCGEIKFGSSTIDAGTIDDMACRYFRESCAKCVTGDSFLNKLLTFIGISKFSLDGLTYHLDYNRNYVVSYNQLVFTALALSSFKQSAEPFVDLSSLEQTGGSFYIIP